MSKNLIYFFMGISLSMDAFSLALSLGTLSPNKRKIIIISSTIGIFHFIMPLIGRKIGTILSLKDVFPTNYISATTFFILAIEMLKNKDKEENFLILNYVSILLISLSVSLDSFTIGLIFGINQEFSLTPNIIFSCISTFFTIIGLSLGKVLQKKLQKKSNIIGFLLMFLIGTKYLLIQ